MNANQLGFLFGLTEHNRDISDGPRLIGLSKRASENPEAWGKPILRQASQALWFRSPHSAPAYHLHFLCKSAWSPHTDEVLDLVLTAAQAQQQVKKATSLASFTNPGLAGLGLAGKGLLYGAAAGGAGAGALWWLLNRHASQDEADNAGKQQQVDYYQDLARELEDSMRRNYDYQDDRRSTARKQAR